jgi:hypothetical protein
VDVGWDVERDADRAVQPLFRAMVATMVATIALLTASVASGRTARRQRIVELPSELKSNVIVASLSIRDAVNDGIQVAPKGSPAHGISNIVIDRCSVTNSADGGIDVTGKSGLTTSNVT